MTSSGWLLNITYVSSAGTIGNDNISVGSFLYGSG